MSHATLEKQIQSLPDDCIDEVSSFIEFLLFRRNTKKDMEQKSDLSEFFGSVKNLPDGIDFQKRARDEWD